MSLALARATIAPMLPPSEWETYQTHIPWRSNAVLLTLPPVSTCPAPPVSAEAAVGMSASAMRSVSAASIRSRGLTTGLNTVVGEVVRDSVWGGPGWGPTSPPGLTSHTPPQPADLLPAISPSRKILCAAVLASCALSVASSARASELHQISGLEGRKFDAVRRKGTGARLRHAGL